MHGFAKQFAEKRKEKGFTQSEVAEKLGVSFQAVSLWERGETTPDINKLPEIAKLFDVSIDWLLNSEKVKPQFDTPKSDRLFDEERMHTYVKTYATAKGMYQTVEALKFAKEHHAGQYRKGDTPVPYIYHPLQVACHALALGLCDDNIVSAALLHDVVEDCKVKITELPVNEETKEAIALLTKEQGYNEKAYYEAIGKNPIAVMVKLLDRCSNVSGMSAGFTKEKLVQYVNETEHIFYPLMEHVKSTYPMYSNQAFLLKYHISSVIEAVKHLI